MTNEVELATIMEEFGFPYWEKGINTYNKEVIKFSTGYLKSLEEVDKIIDSAMYRVPKRISKLGFRVFRHGESHPAGDSWSSYSNNVDKIYEGEVVIERKPNEKH